MRRRIPVFINNCPANKFSLIIFGFPVFNGFLHAFQGCVVKVISAAVVRIKKRDSLRFLYYHSIGIMTTECHSFYQIMRNRMTFYVDMDFITKS